MKDLIRNPLLGLLFLGCIGLAVIGSSKTNVQITSSISLQTKFPFTVGNTKLPAGDYSIKQMENDPEIMEISSEDGKTAVLFEILSAKDSATPLRSEVIFRKYGDDYVLSEIYESGNNIGAIVPKSHTERQYAKKSGVPSKESVVMTKTP